MLVPPGGGEIGEQERAWQMRLLGFEPIFDPIRTEPRFQAMLVRLGLRSPEQRAPAGS